MMASAGLNTTTIWRCQKASGRREASWNSSAQIKTLESCDHESLLEIRNSDA
jgi:hypothetical protein